MWLWASLEKSALELITISIYIIWMVSEVMWFKELPRTFFPSFLVSEIIGWFLVYKGAKKCVLITSRVNNHTSEILKKLQVCIWGKNEVKLKGLRSMVHFNPNII